MDERWVQLSQLNEEFLLAANLAKTQPAILNMHMTPYAQQSNSARLS